MKKYVKIILSLSLIVLVLCGCGNSESKTNQVRVKKCEFKGIECYIPEDWEEGDTSEENKYYYPESGMLMITVTDDTVRLYGESVWDSYMDGMKSGFTDYKQESLEGYSINNFEGFRAKFSGVISDRKSIVDMIVVNDQSDRLVSFTMATFDKKEQLYSQDLEDIVKSLSVTTNSDDSEIEEEKEVVVETVKVIDFSKKSESEAKEWCEENNLECEISNEYSEKVKKGKLISQSVKKGKTVDEGSTIKLVYSEGKEPTTERLNALEQAQYYSDTLHLSKKGIYKQLTSEYGEGFDKDAANYALENLDVDYKENALKSAKTYRDMSSMSKKKIFEQLISEYGEGFTKEEAQYAIDHLDD